MKWFTPTYHVGIHTRSSRLCYCEGASDCGITALTLKLTAYSWSNKSCLSTSLSIGLTTRLTSTAMRINTPYHQGSLSSETRLSGNTLSRQGNLTFHPPCSGYLCWQSFLFPPRSLCSQHSKALPQNSSWVNRDPSATTDLKQREERRTGHDNTIQLDLIHF